MKEENKKDEITLGKIAEDWLAIKEKQLRKQSYFVYKTAVYQYIIPNIGNVKLSEMEDYDYMDFVKKISAKDNPRNINTKTARDVVVKLKSILFYAEDTYGLRIRTRKIELPPEKKKRVKNSLINAKIF